MPVITIASSDVPIYNEWVGQTRGEADIEIRARVPGMHIHAFSPMEIMNGAFEAMIGPVVLYGGTLDVKAKTITDEMCIAAALELFERQGDDLFCEIPIKFTLANNAIVLLSPLGFSPTGEAFNLTMEDVATATAMALQADKLSS